MRADLILLASAGLAFIIARAAYKLLDNSELRNCHQCGHIHECKYVFRGIPNAPGIWICRFCREGIKDPQNERN